MTPDASVYPDLAEPPTVLEDESARADYLLRICAAWDYGIVPEDETIALMATWESALFDRHRLIHSPAYHALRLCLGLDALPPAREGEALLVEAAYQMQDRREGRDDPCEALV